jgi:hypothetical protein
MAMIRQLFKILGPPSTSRVFRIILFEILLPGSGCCRNFHAILDHYYSADKDHACSK